SVGLALIWRGDRREAAARRFDADERVLEDRMRSTIENYVHTLEVTRGFFRSTPDATQQQFLTFASGLDFEVTTPALVSLHLIAAVPRAEAASGPSGVAYPVEMVAPRSAAIGLLYRDLSYDPSVRTALPTVARRGGVTMMPPRIDVFRHLRMLLVGSIPSEGGTARWVGASIDPSLLATQVLATLPTGVRASMRWETDGQTLGTVLGPATTGSDAAILAVRGPVPVVHTGLRVVRDDEPALVP